MDKISIIMGIYNCEQTLPEAIESIIGQTYTNWELIMCDDASTDGTYKVARGYVERYPEKMILLINEKNSRLAYTLNHCLKHASGKYIARMDGDDKCLPERFEKQLSFLQAHPELQLCGTAMQRFNEEGLHDILYAVDKPDYYTLKEKIPFHHATILTYNDVYQKLGGYTVAERTKRAQDYDLWFRFYHEGYNGDSLKEPLYLVREDGAAIRRRTFKVRWSAYQTTKYGYKLLGYPKRWLIRPTLSVLVKSLTPFVVVDWYRKLQQRRAERREG